MVLSAIVDISDRKHKEESIHAALKEKDILLGEIHHRVKNNLQIVHSLLDLQSSNITDHGRAGPDAREPEPHPVDGADPPDALRVEGFRAGRFRQLSRRAGADAGLVLRRRGSIACTLSHRRAWKCCCRSMPPFPAA